MTRWFIGFWPQECEDQERRRVKTLAQVSRVQICTTLASTERRCFHNTLSCYCHVVSCNSHLLQRHVDGWRPVWWPIAHSLTEPLQETYTATGSKGKQLQASTCTTHCNYSKIPSSRILTDALKIHCRYTNADISPLKNGIFLDALTLKTKAPRSLK